MRAMASILRTGDIVSLLTWNTAREVLLAEPSRIAVFLEAARAAGEAVLHPQRQIDAAHEAEAAPLVQVFTTGEYFRQEKAKKAMAKKNEAARKGSLAATGVDVKANAPKLGEKAPEGTVDTVTAAPAPPPE